MNQSLTQFVGRVGGSQRLLVAMVGLGAFAAVWGFARWGASPSWVSVTSGLPIERIGEATQRLDEEGIAYRLERGGSVISVEERSAARARVVLAADGLGGGARRPGFELFDQPSWGMTDFTQRVNYRRALEGELERTIGAMRDIDAAQVHLSLQESSFLKSSGRPSEASVVLQLGGAAMAEQSTVEGIQFLVSSSVEGMAPENVMVLDDRGRLLSSPDDDGGVGLSNRQLQVQRQIEGYLQSKAAVLVEQMVGPSNATVRVSAALNFDQIGRTVQGVDPDQQVLVSEDRSEITPGSTDQGAASVSSNTVYETARTVETLARGGARLERLTVAVVLGDRRLEGADGNTSFQPRTPQEMQQVESVVRNAVGFSAARGDEISVVSVPLEQPEPIVPIEEKADIAALMVTFQKPVVALAGLLVALMITTKLLASLRSTSGARPAVALAGGGTSESLGRSDSRHAGGSAAPPQIAAAVQPTPAATVSDPNMTARVVRAWMKD
jgi:flagellar M-ring protein FliF